MATKPNVYQARLIEIRPQYTHDPDSGDNPENVLWMQSASAGTPTLANLTTIQNIFDAQWKTLFAAYGATTANYTGSVITDWSSNTGLSQSSVGVLTPEAGANGSPTPPQVSILISYVIQLRWRGGHFRTYLPYVGQSGLTNTNNDSISSGLASTIGTHYNSVNTNLGSSGVFGGQQLVMYKNKNNPATATVYPIAGFIVNTLLATQRRRLRVVPHR